jgi:aconitase A
MAELQPRQQVEVAYVREDGSAGAFTALARIDGPTELAYLHEGGILPAVLRRLYRESAPG